LVNLIENAVKYGQEGGHVWVRDVRHGDSVSITVEDDGPGISPQHRERLFERFYRVDTGRSRAEGGTGLGLSIVKHLVNAMGFEISMEAREPHGCCFRIETAIERVTVAS
jgi:signal transduction histidine kinase